MRRINQHSKAISIARPFRAAPAINGATPQMKPPELPDFIVRKYTPSKGAPPSTISIELPIDAWCIIRNALRLLAKVYCAILPMQLASLIDSEIKGAADG